MLAYINKSTLKTICDNMGVQHTYIADAVKCKPAAKVNDWMNESSSSLPTFNQAKKIAKCLKVPFAGLYMNPDDVRKIKVPQLTSRRTFPDGYLRDESSLNIAVADLLTSRDFLLSMNAELNEQIPIFNISIPHEDNPLLWANSIRQLFGISLSEQFKFTSSRQFYLYVRKQVEAKGIFVHCFTDVYLQMARGLAIYNDIMPIIGINADDRYPAKIFTIIHELTHILKRQSSVCNEIFNSFTQQQEEIFCNAVAGEVLIPTESLEIKLNSPAYDGDITVAVIDSLSKTYSVSKEVVARRLLDTGKISNISYDTYIDEFKRALEREKEELKVAKLEGRSSQFRRNPSRDAIDKNSSSICLALFKGFGDDLYSKRDVCRYLGISQKYADRFLTEVSKWNN